MKKLMLSLCLIFVLSISSEAQIRPPRPHYRHYPKRTVVQPRQKHCPDRTYNPIGGVVMDFFKALNITGWIFILALIIGLIVDIKTKGKVIYEIVLWTKRKAEKRIGTHSEKNKLKYEKELQRRNYICWQKEVLRRLYEDIINRFNAEQNVIPCKWAMPFSHCKTNNISQPLRDSNIANKMYYEAIPEEKQF